MKNILFIPVLIFTFFQGFCQSTCSEFYPFTEGTTSQITTYNKKGKVAAITDFTVVSSTATSASMSSKLSDKRGELISESTYDILCSGNGISIDFKSMISPQITQQFNDMETEVSGTNLALPNNLEINQELPDADVHLEVNMAGIPMKMDFGMTDRKVIGKESVTTPAGTFECYVIAYAIDLKMGMRKTGSAKQWIAKGVGMVKQEDYNKKGKVTSSSLLTAFQE